MKRWLALWLWAMGGTVWAGVPARAPAPVAVAASTPLSVRQEAQGAIHAGESVERQANSLAQRSEIRNPLQDTFR